MKKQHRNLRNLLLWGGLWAGVLIGLMGPAATALQMPPHIANNANDIDVLYLVCGARAQTRRLATMQAWLQQDNAGHVAIWIGNDAHNSRWSQQQQRNLTRAEWAHKYSSRFWDRNRIKMIPGTFTNTDGEMAALAETLRQHPEVNHVALVTCGFHARRAWTRFNQYAPAANVATLIPVRPYWENRAPWIVVAEWLKILRDHLNLAQHPWFSRQP